MSPLYSSKATVPLHIVIVGCGLGGLAAAFCLAEAGHRITVLEAASQIGEVGAGIQVSPNLSRLLIRWGLSSKLDELAVVPESICFKRWNTGEQVGITQWGEKMRERYGAPYYHIHRADFHTLLFDLASPRMDLRINCRVVSVDPSAPSVTLATGEVVNADLILGADGVHSTLREVVVGGPDSALATGDAAYRAIISTEPMLKDPLLRSLVENPQMSAWMGPGRHLMGYCIRAKKEYNLVMLHPDKSGGSSDESWTSEGNANQMRADFVGWEPRITKLLALVPSTLNWLLKDRAPLDTWLHKGGKLALLGDACHPMLPYRAQGSAMAIEDAAVLGNLLSRLTSPSQLRPLLEAYEKLRLPRASATQAQSRLNQHIFHLPDGPEQEARDESMRAAVRMSEEGQEALDTEGCANQWADEQKSDIQFNYDPDAEVDKWWKDEGQRLLAVPTPGGSSSKSVMARL